MGKRIPVLVEDGKLIGIVSRYKEKEREVRKTSYDLLLLRFDQGCILGEVMNNSSYGDSAIKKIARDLGMNSTRFLYQIHTVASFFNYNRKALEQDAKKHIETANITYYLKEFANPDQSPKAIGGGENDKQRLLDLAERGSEALKKAAELYPDDPEVVGVVTAYYEDITDEESDAEFIIGNPQKAAPIGFYAGESGERIEDIEYLEWLRACPCCITGAYGNIDVNHIRQKGRDRNNASDYMALPFNRDLHTGNPKSFHRMKFDEFEEYWSKRMGKEINLRKFVFQHLQKYIIHLRSTAKF